MVTDSPEVCTDCGDIGTIGTAPSRAGNTTQGLTTSSEYSREGLAMKATHVQGVTPDQISAVTRILAKVKIDPVTECWECSLSNNREGYAIVGAFGRRLLAHRVMLATIGGLDVNAVHPDHLAIHGCDNPPCVNPNHLRWGSHADNTRDKVERGRHYNGWTGRTHCPRGHALTGANLVPGALRAGHRACLVCNRARSAVVASKVKGVEITLQEAVARELARTDKGRDEVSRDALSNGED